MKLKTILMASCLGVVSSANASEDLPIVPLSVMKQHGTAPSNNAVQAQSATLPVGATLSEDLKPELIVEPGVNQVIPIAIGHLNRLVTPWPEPQVTTTSAVTTEIRENIIYVASEQSAPVTLFITSKESEHQAISITLWPRKMPPREVVLKLKNSGSIQYFRHKKAEKWEISQPYVATIVNVFKSMALGEVPQGYTLHSTPAGAILPSCRQKGLRFSFANGQMLMGHHLNIYVGTAENISDRPIEFKEQQCGSWDVAGITAWPLNMLKPGQKTEIYVAKKQLNRRSEPVSGRPSLLAGSR